MYIIFIYGTYKLNFDKMLKFEFKNECYDIFHSPPSIKGNTTVPRVTVTPADGDNNISNTL